MHFGRDKKIMDCNARLWRDNLKLTFTAFIRTKTENCKKQCTLIYGSWFRKGCNM
jgi:hypothetical protein